MSNLSSTLLPPLAASSPPPPPPSYTTYSLTDFGFVYALAIALGFLLLLSTLLLSTYICCRRHLLHRPPSAGFIVPRVIFVSEDDEENPRPASAVGLDVSIINSYPKFPYFKSSSNDSAASGGESASGTCSICLCDYREGEMLRMMPDCKHSFHVLCLDAWLCLSGSCPVCRSSPLPTPLSTPLAEVAPLAFFPDNRHRRS